MSIRAAALQDAEAINAIYNHFVEHSVATFDVQPWDLARRREWISSFAASADLYRLLVREEAGEVVGFACNGRLRDKDAYRCATETTIYVDPRRQGRGIGRQLYGALLDGLDRRRLHRAYGCIALPGEASLRLHRQLGFRQVGIFDEVGLKFGRYHSVAWMELKL